MKPSISPAQQNLLPLCMDLLRRLQWDTVLLWLHALLVVSKPFLSHKTQQTHKNNTERWARNETYSTGFGFGFVREKRKVHLCWHKTTEPLLSHSNEDQSGQVAVLVARGW